MKQETVVYIVGVLLAVAAGVAIGGSPFGGGGGASISTDTAGLVDTDPADAVVPTTNQFDSLSPPTTSPRPTATTTPRTSTTASSTTSTPVASAGPAPSTMIPPTSSAPTTIGTTEPDDSVSDAPDDDLRGRGSLTVAVVNASGRGGVAEAKVAQLNAAGYIDVAAVDIVPMRTTSFIYFAPGLDREVFLAAFDLAWDGVELLPIAEAPDLESPGEFDLLVLVGDDRFATIPAP